MILFCPDDFRRQPSCVFKKEAGHHSKGEGESWGEGAPPQSNGSSGVRKLQHIQSAARLNVLDSHRPLAHCLQTGSPLASAACWGGWRARVRTIAMSGRVWSSLAAGWSMGGYSISPERPVSVFLRLWRTRCDCVRSQSGNVLLWMYLSYQRLVEDLWCGATILYRTRCKT